MIRIVSVLLFLSSFSFSQQPITVPLSGPEWTLDQSNFKIPEEYSLEDNGKMVEFQGKEAFRMARGIAFVKGLHFQDGTIEVDMAGNQNSRFFGITFRVQSADEYEVIFFRPSQSGNNQAVQYTPSFKGATLWQIFHDQFGGGAMAKIPRNEWIHVKLEVKGRSARLFLNNAAEPTMVIPDLKMGDSHGSIGFWGHLGGGYFANLVYTPRVRSEAEFYPAPKPQLDPKVITDWEISDAYDSMQQNPEVYPNVRAMKWEKVPVEEPGMVLVNRYRLSPSIFSPADPESGAKRPQPGSRTVFARTIVRAGKAEIRKLKIAYSDDVTVFLNGKPIYSGNNEFGIRAPNATGLFTYDADALFLPLKKGENELVLAVTEFFGGWAFMGKWE
jgi:hypothetical protein